MDFTVLKDYFVLVVVVACLVLGYIIKHATFMKWLPNDDIPVVLTVVGAVLNVLVSGFATDIQTNVETVVFGALMGLASTGMHQAFKKFVEGTKEGTE